MTRQDSDREGPGVVIEAASAALRQAYALARTASPGDALRRLSPLREAAQRVADCFEPGREPAIRQPRDGEDLARARARILLNKIRLMEASDRAGPEAGSHQKSGSAG